MALNIKNERTVRLAREYAAMTGTTVTGAITVALEKSLAELDEERETKRAELRRLLESLKGTLTLEPGVTAERATDFLYDPETGLPA